MSNLNVKLDAQASIRYPSDWDAAIEKSAETKTAWIREAVRRRLIDENLISNSDSYFSHEIEHISKNTMNTLKSGKNTNVFKNLIDFFSKYQAQKKTDGTRSFSAHSSQG